MRASNEALQYCSFQARSLSLKGWGLIDLPLRATFSPAHPLACRDVPLARARASCFLLCIIKPSPQGSRRTVLHCVHRTSTVSSCAFCEQEGWSGGSLLILRLRVARTQEIIRLHSPSRLLCSHRPTPPNDLSPSIATSRAHEAICLHLFDHPSRPRIAHPQPALNQRRRS